MAFRLQVRLRPPTWKASSHRGRVVLPAGYNGLVGAIQGLLDWMVQFFLNNKNAIQGDETKQREAFRLMYPYFVAVCRDRKTEIEQRLGSGMNTSPMKVVDNAIVGYGRTVLQIRGERSDGDE